MVLLSFSFFKIKMKFLVKSFLLLGILCLPSASYTQTLGEVLYKKEMIIPDEIFGSLKNTNPQLYRQRLNTLHDIAQVTAEIEYNLVFNENESLFRPKEIMGKDESLFGSIQSRTGIFYNNTSSNNHLQQIERQGKTFLITRKDVTWKITDETKTINGLRSQKAVAKRNYYHVRTNKNIVRTIVAWFAPEIPVSFGPDGFGGLPGLILELEIANERYYVVDVDLKRTTQKIHKPTKGEEVTFEEYQNILAQMGERFRQFQGI